MRDWLGGVFSTRRLPDLRLAQGRQMHGQENPGYFGVRRGFALGGVNADP